MSASASNRRACPEGFAAARLAKANGFMEAAQLTKTFDEGTELRDARLGDYHSSDNHNAAVTMLAEVDQELSEQLRRLLRLKTKAGCSGAPASADDEKVAERAATKLLQAARGYQ